MGMMPAKDTNELVHELKNTRSMAAFLQENQPDFLLIRHNGLAPLASRLGIPSAPLGDEHIAVGYDGIVNLGETILEILAHKKFHDDIKQHVKLPYKKWWLEQKDAYILEEQDTDEFRDEFHKYYTHYATVDDFEEIEDEPIKISLFDAEGKAIESILPTVQRFDGPLQVVASSDWWVDVMAFGINKGIAIQQVQKRMHIWYGKDAMKSFFYKGLRKAYPAANYRDMSNYGHAMYCIMDPESYVKDIENIIS